MKKQNDHTVVTFPASRLFTIDIGVLGSQRHHVKALVELDVTKARRLIKRLKEREGRRVSFTAWMLTCIARALDEHRTVHALRAGGRTLVLFNDVDMTVMVEKEKQGTRVPVPYVLRNTARKSVEAITAEIAAVKKADLADRKLNLDHTGGPGEALFALLPQGLRLAIWRLLLRDPHRVKRMMGTCLVTSVGMFGRLPGWAIPASIHPVSFTLGSIVPKAVMAKGRPRERDILHLTVLFDHDVVDGAPAARFMAELQRLVENAAGLTE